MVTLVVLCESGFKHAMHSDRKVGSQRNVKEAPQRAVGRLSDGALRE